MAAIIFAKKILSWLGFETSFHKTVPAALTPILLETMGKGGTEEPLVRQKHVRSKDSFAFKVYI